jgi:hypothetical protein
MRGQYWAVAMVSIDSTYCSVYSGSTIDLPDSFARLAMSSSVSPIHNSTAHYRTGIREVVRTLRQFRATDCALAIFTVR